MKSCSGSPISCDQIQQLISHIYDAALEPEKWKVALEKIADLLKAEQAYMRIINTKTNDVQLAYCHNKDPDWVRAYKDHYVHIDPWLNTILKAKNSFIACTHHYMSDKKYQSLEFYNDFVSPQGTHFGLGGKIHIGENITNYLALNRQKKKQGFENEHFNTMQLLAPHIQKSLIVNAKTRHIELKQNLLSDALNQINNPLLLVNKNGKVLFINSLAEQLIEKQAGIFIKDNHIYILSTTDNNKLQKLIYSATHHFVKHGGAMRHVDLTTQSAISILVSPVNPNIVNLNTQCDNNALLVLNPHQQQETISTELLTNLYGLTPAEARLTVELCQGFTLNEIAGKFSLSKNTLRSQLHSCFSKTGTSRQANLIRLINEGSAGAIKKTST